MEFISLVFYISYWLFRKWNKNFQITKSIEQRKNRIRKVNHELWTVYITYYVKLPIKHHLSEQCLQRYSKEKTYVQSYINKNK